MMNLVIVESPAKSKTLKKFLGANYEILASYGHIRDLIPKGGAVEPDKAFTMNYQIINEKKRYINAIISKCKQADQLYLATDPDREGEAISWHLHEILRKKKMLREGWAHRVVFFEITKDAVLEAFASPRKLSDNLVNAQQARRALDYLIGFTLSPLLCKKVGGGLSAGRVQSPALRLIVDREDEIEAFVRREHWSIEAQLDKNGEKFGAYLHKKNNVKLKRFDIDNEKSAHNIRDALKEARPTLVSAVDKKEKRRKPAPPFMTSTLQQEAARKLGFAAKHTMRVAQQLYEGINLGSGQAGLITYMRTDSLVLSAVIVKEIRDHIKRTYGAENLPEKTQVYKNRSKNAQEAHEAIRPTSIKNVPEKIKAYLDRDQFRLYELIWNRSLACQMIHATYDTVSADIACGKDFILRATGSTIKHPGFLAIYREGSDQGGDDEKNGGKYKETNKRLPELKEGDALVMDQVKAEQHFTEPPPRFSEASLIKALEQHGIGRPSTYASILSTIQSRSYVKLESKRFTPTPTGRIVSRFLVDNFTRYVDYEFTARLEDELDEVSRGELHWRKLMEKFWEPFQSLVDEKDKTVSRKEVMAARVLGKDPKSEKEVSVRLGRYGPFVQIGHREDEEKPRFASLKPGQKVETVTLEEALALFEFPRTLGETDTGETVQVCLGRWGPYLKYGTKNVSLKEDDPNTIALERALGIIEEKKKNDAERIIQDFGDRGIQVLNGRWGPYVSDGKKNVTIRNKDPKSLTLEMCKEMLASAPDKKGRRFARKKSS